MSSRCYSHLLIYYMNFHNMTTPVAMDTVMWLAQNIKLKNIFRGGGLTQLLPPPLPVYSNSNKSVFYF